MSIVKIPAIQRKEAKIKKRCSNCKHHYLLWDWDNGHDSVCDRNDRSIPSPSRFDYPVEIPKWCDGWEEKDAD